jgi:threonine synthase
MDAKTSLRKRVGDTPLMQAPHLSEFLGLSNLWLKLEGSNPTGTQKDRIARLDVAEAVRRGMSGVTVATCGNYGVALAYAAYVHDVTCHVFTPDSFRGERVALMEELGAIVHRLPGTYEDAVDASREFAENEGLHDANPGGSNTLQAMTGYTRIADEIIQSMDELPVVVGVPVGNGTTLAGVHLGFRAAWARGTIKDLPRVAAGTSAGNNPLDGATDNNYQPLDPASTHETEVNEPLVNWDAMDGRAAVEAVVASGGATYGATDAQLMDIYNALLEDGIEAHPASCAALYAIQQLVADRKLDATDPYVAILTSGRPRIQVEILDEVNVDELLPILDAWLGKYADPEVEAREAVQAAKDGGHILRATKGRRTLGYCILTPMELGTFFPRLHLSYIGVDPKARGLGVGTQLLEEAIRVSDGDLSLHVDVDNIRAIRLYEKFGFARKYYRMLHRPGRTPDVDLAKGSRWDGAESESKGDVSLS